MAKFLKSGVLSSRRVKESLLQAGQVDVDDEVSTGASTDKRFRSPERPAGASEATPPGHAGLSSHAVGGDRSAVGPCEGNVADCQLSSGQFGVTGSASAQSDPSSETSQFDCGSHRMPLMEPNSDKPPSDSSYSSATAQQRARNGTEERHNVALSADDTQSQANISAPSNCRQATPQTSNPHIINPPVLRAISADAQSHVSTMSPAEQSAITSPAEQPAIAQSSVSTISPEETTSPVVQSAIASPAKQSEIAQSSGPTMSPEKQSVTEKSSVSANSSEETVSAVEQSAIASLAEQPVMAQSNVPTMSSAEQSAISRINQTIVEANELHAAVEQFSGADKSSKQYRYLEEMLTRLLLRLHAVDSLGLDKIRMTRKNAIVSIQAILDQLELKVIAR